MHIFGPFPKEERVIFKNSRLPALREERGTIHAGRGLSHFFQAYASEN
jgi:hypothetical protein